MEYIIGIDFAPGRFLLTPFIPVFLLIAFKVSIIMGFLLMVPIFNKAA